MPYCWLHLLSLSTFLLTPVFPADDRLLNFFPHSQPTSVVITISEALRRKRLSWWTFLFTQHCSSLATGALPLGWGVNDCTRPTSTHLSWHKAEHLAKADQSEYTVPQVKQFLVTRNLIQTWPTSVNPKVLLALSEKRVSIFFNINTYKNNKAPHGKPARGKANTEESKLNMYKSHRRISQPSCPWETPLPPLPLQSQNAINSFLVCLFVCFACYYVLGFKCL